MRLRTEIGDVIQTVRPMNCDSPLVRAGEYLHVRLDTAEACIEADELLKTGRWKIVEEKASKT